MTTGAATTVPPMEPAPRVRAIEDYEGIAKRLKELAAERVPAKCQMTGCEACGPDWVGCAGHCLGEYCD